MKIDKSRFVLLTSALASGTVVVAASASGCTVTSTATNDAAVPTTPDAGSPVTESGDGGDSRDDVDAGACLGATGAAPTCQGTCDSSCLAAVAFFKTDVATSIDDCLQAAAPGSPTDEQCSTAATACVEAAAGKACDDANAASFCTTFLASCPDQVDGGAADQTAAQADCVGFTRAMTDDGRAALQQCVTEGGTCADCIAEKQNLTTK